MKTAFVESTPQLSVRELELKEDTVAIEIDGQEIAVELESYLFGMRSWFLCPDCGKRRVKVYLFRERWACRECHGLVYLSQWRHTEQRLQKEYEELWEEVKDGKPKWQHRRTHWRKMSRFGAIQEILLTASVQRLGRNKWRFLRGINNLVIDEIEWGRID
jgi:ribosomal protein L37AE/L43A